MFFVSLILIALTSWFCPWWSLVLVAGALSSCRTPSWMVTIAAMMVWPALAFIQDGLNHGQISGRMAGLLQLPEPILIFVLMAILAGVTAWLACQVGALLRSAYTDWALAKKSAGPSAGDRA
jgi:hypothetical protein